MKQSSIVLLVVVLVVAVLAVGTVVFYVSHRNGAESGVTQTAGAGTTNTSPAGSSPVAGVAGLPAIASSTTPIPAAYQSLYDGLQQNLNTYDAEVEKTWTDSPAPVAYATELISANCNQGTKMLSGLSNGLATVNDELTGLQKLGVKAVTICIGYPQLDTTFWNSASVNQPQYYSQFLTYYQDVVQAAHQKGMKVIVESDALFTTGVPSNLVTQLTAYYKSLTFAQFENGRAAEDVIIAQQIKPDYLLIQTEPSSEAYEAHRPELNDPTQDVAMVSDIASALNSANIPGLHTSIIVGSGLGSWQNQWQAYLSGLLKIPGLDLIDTHNYFTSGGDIDNELSIVSQVKQAGKQLGMSEYWLKKSLSPAPSLTTPTFAGADDDYSFWAPLDQQYIRLMYMIANENQFAYTSAFNDLQMFAYLDYDQVQSQICGGQTCTKTDNPKITAAIDQKAVQGFSSGSLTTTGVFFKNLITK